MSERRPVEGAAPRSAKVGQRPTTRRKPVFDKEHATLWLLTVTLGLGVGAVFRFVERSQAAAPSRQLAVEQSSQLPAYGSAQNATNPYLNQRVTVLPQRTYSARGRTRMS
jgi:hypothetical protein